MRSTSSHDISVLCHQQLPLALKSRVRPSPLDGVESTAARNSECVCHLIKHSDSFSIATLAQLQHSRYH